LSSPPLPEQLSVEKPAVLRGHRCHEMHPIPVLVQVKITDSFHDVHFEVRTKRCRGVGE